MIATVVDSVTDTASSALAIVGHRPSGAAGRNPAPAHAEARNEHAAEPSMLSTVVDAVTDLASSALAHIGPAERHGGSSFRRRSDRRVGRKLAVGGDGVRHRNERLRCSGPRGTTVRSVRPYGRARRGGTCSGRARSPDRRRCNGNRHVGERRSSGAGPHRRVAAAPKPASCATSSRTRPPPTWDRDAEPKQPGRMRPAQALASSRPSVAGTPRSERPNRPRREDRPPFGTNRRHGQAEGRPPRPEGESAQRNGGKPQFDNRRDRNAWWRAQ